MDSKLSEEEMWTYSRQVVLPEIGYEGQLKLKKGHVLLVGIGGLGTPIAFQLTAMGVGNLKIVDRDVVSISDLHRQYLYDVDSLGLPKVEVASSKLSKLNPQVKVDPIPISIKSWNIKSLLKDVDVVVDGLDSIETRYLINRECVKTGIPYVHGGAIKTMGNISTIIPKKTPCLECFNPNLKDEELPKCGVVGVYTPLLGIIASIEVSETVMLLTDNKPRLAGKILYIDPLDLAFEEITITQNERCPVCGSEAEYSPPKLKEKLVEEECSRDGRITLVVTPKKWIEIDLEKAKDHLMKLEYEVERKGRMGITCSDEKRSTLSLLKTGVAIFKFPPSRKSANIRHEVISLYKELLETKLNIPQEALPLEIIK